MGYIKLYLRLFCCCMILFAEAQNQEPFVEEILLSSEEISKPEPIKLYLASNAVAVMDDIIPLLPFAPNGRQVCYITTAGYNAPWIQDNIKKIEAEGFQVRPVDLAVLSPKDLDAVFEGCDIIWVGGGNTFYLLQEVRQSGFDAFLKQKIASGIPYVGTSAGSIILGPHIELVKFADDPMEAPDLTSYEGLDVFPLVPLAHIDNPYFKGFYKDILLFALEHDIPFVSLKEQQFIFVEGENWKIVNSQKR